MPLYIKDDAVDDLARQLMALTKAASKSEAVKTALKDAITRHGDRPKLSDVARRFRQDLAAKAQAGGMLADKAFRDSLYEDG